MAEDWQQKLGLLLANLGGGISSAASANLPPWHGIGPGAMGFANALGQQQKLASQQAQQQELMDLQRKRFGLQESEFQDKRDERKRLEAARMGWTPPGATPGMGVPTAAPTIGPGPDVLKRGQEFTSYLTEKHGLPPVAAAGVVGGLQQESGFEPTTVHDQGTGYGLAGWRLDRRDGLMNFAKTQGKNASDPYVQLDYLVNEMKGGDMGAQRAYAMLQRAKSPEEATTAMMHFFRPAGYTPANPQAGHGFQNRVQYAQNFMPGGMPQVAQGDNIPRADGSGTPLPPQNTIAPPMLEDVPRPALPTADAQRLQRAVQGGLMTIPQAETEARQIIDGLWTHQREMAKARFTQGSKDQWRTLEPREVAMYPGLDPNKTYQRNQRGEIKPIGGAGVTVNTGTKGIDAFVKQRAEAYETKIRPQAQGALDEITSMHTIRQLLDAGAYTGLGAEAKLLADRVGELFGLPSEQAANTQALMGAAAERVLSVVKTLGANPSNADREYLEKAKGGKITFTEGGLRRILDIGERAARNTIKRHGDEVSRLRKVEGLQDLPEEYWQIGDAPDYKTWAEANPLAPQTPAPPPPDAPQGPATPKTKAEFDALPPGTQFKAPDGSLRVKP